MTLTFDTHSISLTHRKAYVTKFDLGVNVSRSTLGNNLNSLGSTCIDNVTYKVSRSSVYWVWRRRFLRFLPYLGMAAMLVM